MSQKFTAIKKHWQRAAQLKYKTTYFLIALLVLLGLITLIIESPWDEDEKPFFADFAADKIAKMEVIDGSGTETTKTLVKRDGIWYLTAPEEYRAEQDSVQEMLDAASNITILRLVSRDLLRKDQFGLGATATTVTFWDAKDQEVAKVIIGNVGSGLDCYVMKAGERETYLAKGYLKGVFTRSLFNLKHKAILDLKSETLTEIAWKKADSTLKIVQEDAEWQITEPEQIKADQNKINALLSSLVGLQTVEFPNITPETATGLSEPQLTLEITADGTKTVLKVGQTVNEEAGTFYVQVEGQEQIFVINNEQLLSIDQTLENLKFVEEVVAEQPDIKTDMDDSVSEVVELIEE